MSSSPGECQCEEGSCVGCCFVKDTTKIEPTLGFDFLSVSAKENRGIFIIRVLKMSHISKPGFGDIEPFNSEGGTGLPTEMFQPTWRWHTFVTRKSFHARLFIQRKRLGAEIKRYHVRGSRRNTYP